MCLLRIFCEAKLQRREDDYIIGEGVKEVDLFSPTLGVVICKNFTDQSAKFGEGE